jgi:uncharacterized protein (TIGR02246 family)
MKKMTSLFFAVTIHSAVNAQTASHVAERYRSFYNSDAATLNNLNFYSINKQSIMKKTILMATVISAAMAVNGQTTNKDEQSIRNIVTTMQKGWNEKSGQVFASVFDKVHNYIVVTGMYMPSITQEINANAHQQIFNSIYKTTDLELRIDKISFVRPDLAMVYVLGGQYQHGAALPENPSAIVSLVVEKKNDNWKIISFHNCPIQLSFEPGQQQGPVPVKVMYASWYK